MSGVDIFAVFIAAFTVTCWVGVIVHGYRGMSLKHGVTATVLMAVYQAATMAALALVFGVLALLLH